MKPKDNMKENNEEHFFKEIIWTLVMETHACNPALGAGGNWGMKIAVNSKQASAT